VSSPSNAFECRWRPSAILLALYLAVLGLALLSVAWLDVPEVWRGLAWLACLAHAVWVLPRHVLLSHRQAFRGLRRSDAGWSLWRQVDGWQAVQLRPDSLALPWVVVLRFRIPGERFSRGVCIARDALPAEQHRRLRVQLKFSRRRWVAPE
jgi:toxin CptA